MPKAKPGNPTALRFVPAPIAGDPGRKARLFVPEYGTTDTSSGLLVLLWVSNPLYGQVDGPVPEQLSNPLYHVKLPALVKYQS